MSAVKISKAQPRLPFPSSVNSHAQTSVHAASFYEFYCMASQANAQEGCFNSKSFDRSGLF